MEYTGTYFEPIAQFLHNNGIFVSVVNALLVHDYGGNSLRKVKTDKKDALKLASYALDRWTELEEYVPADEQAVQSVRQNSDHDKKQSYLADRFCFSGCQ